MSGATQDLRFRIQAGGYTRRRLLIRLGSGAVALTALAAAAGCGVASTQPITAATAHHSPTGATSSAATTTAAGAATSTPAQASVPAKGRTKLLHWEWAGWPQMNGPLTKSFNDAHADLEVTAETPAGNYWDKLQVLFAGNSRVPDTYRINGPAFPFLAAKGLAADISALLAQDRQTLANLDAMTPYHVKHYQWQGKTMGLPQGMTLTALCFNRDLLATAGLDDPNTLGDKWNWDTLVSYAQKLTAKDSSGKQIFGYYADSGWEAGWLPFLYARGGQALNDRATKAEVNSPEGIDTFNFLTSLPLRYHVSPLASDLKGTSAANLWASGAIAMQAQCSCGFNGNVTAISQKNTFTWDVATLPLNPVTKRSGSDSNYAGFVMWPKTAHMDEAWQWQRFITTKEAQEIVGRAQFFPARVEAITTAYIPTIPGPKNLAVLKTVAQQITQDQPASPNVGFSVLYGPMGKRSAEMFSGQSSVKDGLLHMQEDLDALLGASH